MSQPYQQNLFRAWLAPPHDRSLGTTTQEYLIWVQTTLNALVGQQARMVGPVAAQSLPGGVRLQWPEVPGAASYHIQADGAPLGGVPALPGNQGINSFTHAGLSDTTTRTYTVQAATLTGQPGQPSVPVRAAPSTPLHSAISPPTMDQISDGQVAYTRVASVSDQHQATTPSILQGAVSASVQQVTGPYTGITPADSYVNVASITFTPNNGYMRLTYTCFIDTGGGLSGPILLAIYRGTQASGTLLASQSPNMPATSTQSATPSFIGIDPSPGTTSVTYNVYALSFGPTAGINASTLTAENLKV